MKQLKAISLFSGCGGDTIGLEEAGFKVVAHSEIWSKAKKTHNLNIPNSELLGDILTNGDITKIRKTHLEPYIDKIDLLFAGFPCQGFSNAGKKDINDPRNKLFWEFIRVAAILKPQWIIGENVAGLLNRKTDDKQNMVSNIINSAFKDIGYKMAKPTILKAEDYGIPQKRRRVFFVGNLNNIDFKFPNPTHIKSNFKPIKDILDNSIDGIIEINEKIIDNFNKTKAFKVSDNLELNSIKPHPFLKLRLSEDKISFGKRVSPNHIELCDINAPTKTIHCGYSFQPRLFVPILYKNKLYAREFTLNELAKIQDFPSNYKFYGNKNDIIKQIGNAVPPILSKVIAEKIIYISFSTRNLSQNNRI